METQSQASSAAEKKKRVETIVASKGSLTRHDISEKAVASSTTSNDVSFSARRHLLLQFVKYLRAPVNTLPIPLHATDISRPSALKAISGSSGGTGFGSHLAGT
uniref:Uncharacterized protein n=1 Tax=Knipowitschia caucasica TaxID=637954 RepID=A0AAV2L5E5_KNICA